ncbi:MAG: TonB-dependent receptor [Melioribacteraceae bacterium]|nr:TonB-dependent receptor [Melioribacteraceae bacterium]MCF8353184.1 TonB-dependent receptor [Melioribacteraceae bacterium]MCF8395152.1 TonB-dependent receptor [Melioribacteraceae bacterium]MCF8418019.1 TonB-dependent receptor [Melioribacteraceae bacterium]
MKTIKKYLITVLVLVSACSLFAQTGVINGRVTERSTKEALVAANILVIELDNVGTATDMDGKFLIRVPVGSYSVRISLIGFSTVVKTDVIVKTDSEVFLDIPLSETSLEIGSVEVTADYFDKTILENNLSTISLGVEEIKRSPGSLADYQRILQSIAGVSFSNDQTNELLVRGGSPNENLTVFDGMELHSTNHYPNEFNSGGPINMINVSLVQDIQFSLGGFISKYGDKMSSVMSVTTREGTRNKNLTGQTNLTMAGVGAILEGNINSGKGSWLFSARKSYIDLIAGSIGLTAIPKYYDSQFKVVYDLSSNHKISMSGIYGNDKITFDGVPDYSYESKKNVTDSIYVEQVDAKQSQWATGFSLNSLWSNSLYSIITLYGNNYHNDVDVNLDYTQRSFDKNGDLSHSKFMLRNTAYKNISDNYELALKAEFGWNISKFNKLDFGASVKFGGYKQTADIASDTTRYDLNKDGLFDQTVINPSSQLNYDLKLFEQTKSYAYVNNTLELLDRRLILNFGIRYDYFTYSKAGNFSPRLSLSYYLNPAITSINFAYGEYYQTQNYPTYGDRYQSGINKSVENSHSRHFVLGLEHIISDGLKFTVEGYYKKYSNLPVREEFINFGDKTFRSQKILNVGNQDIYGIDFQLQQKLVKDLYGTISFSRMWTNFEDPRIGMEGKNITSEYDFPYSFTVIVGKRFKDLRENSKDWPFYLKYPSYLLPLSDDMEISLKWRYASGKPYTRKEYSPYIQNRVGSITWTEGSWFDSNEINGERYPDYHRLDLGFSSRYNFSNWNLVVTLSIQNLYNRQNIAAYQYNSDGTIDNLYQFSLLPVLGVEVEF